MEQIKSLIQLRGKQVFRYLKDIGYGVLLVLLFVLTGVIFTALQSILTINPTMAIALAFLVLMLIEIRRTDSTFLKSLFETKQELMKYQFIENIIIVFPIILFQSIFQNVLIILSIIGICFIINFIPFHLIKTQQKELKKSIKWIPLSIFEIKFYFEHKKMTFYTIILLLFLGGLHISFWVVGMVFICTLPIEIYSHCEPVEMLNYRPSFIRKKIVASLLFFIIMTIPPIIFIILLQEINILILLYGIVAMILSITLSISKKYTSYYGVNKTIPTTTSNMILVFIMLAPGGILITISACIYYYFKAENHMKNVYAIV